MTYNFDPDRWHQDQRQLLEMRHRDGVLDDAAFEDAMRDLDRRYEAMLARLDGTFELPAATQRSVRDDAG